MNRPGTCMLVQNCVVKLGRYEFDLQRFSALSCYNMVWDSSFNNFTGGRLFAQVNEGQVFLTHYLLLPINLFCPSELQRHYTWHAASWPPPFPKLPTTCGAGALKITCTPSEFPPFMVGQCANVNQSQIWGSWRVPYIHRSEERLRVRLW